MSVQPPPRPSRYELPDPVKVLHNFSNFLAEDAPIPPGIRQARAGYRVGGTGLAEAHCIIDWGEGETGFIVGHYNPAQAAWQIFPESVPDQRQASALIAEMQYKLPGVRRQALAEGRRPGGGFVDLHAPATHNARLRLGQLLEPMEFVKSEPVREALSHGDELHEHEGTSVVGFDTNTFCFPTLGIQTVEHQHVESVGTNDTITTSEMEFRPDALLTLCYTGLIVQSPNQRGRMRAIRHVPVAHSNPDLGWIANADVISPDQWDVLRPVADTLTEISQEMPRFSPLYCSVTYGQPDPDTLQWRL